MKYLYFAESHDGLYVKVGECYRPMWRLPALGRSLRRFHHTNDGFVRFIGVMLSDDTLTEETAFRRKWRANSVAKRFNGDWFRSCHAIRADIETYRPRFLPPESIPKRTF